jgi:hypothetical protein
MGGDFSFDSDSILSTSTTILAADFTYSSDPTAVSLFINPDGPDCPNGNRGGTALTPHDSQEAMRFKRAYP